MRRLFFIGLLSLFFPVFLFSQPVQSGYSSEGGRHVFTLSNNMVTQKVIVDNNMLQADELTGNKEWLAEYHNSDHGVYTDGDYSLQMMWT
ncbi:MAG: hypothetical protein ACRDE5_07020, partial [Ginsengibacter sp.]